MRASRVVLALLLSGGCRAAPVAHPEPTPVGDDTAGVAVPVPCQERAAEPITVEAREGAGATLTLEDTLAPGAEVRGTIALTVARPTEVVIKGTNLTTDVDEFDNDEIPARPRARLLKGIRPLAVSLTGVAAGPAQLEAGVVLSDGTSRAFHWTLDIAARPATACPPPPPRELTVDIVSGGADLGPPRLRIWFTQPPRVGVTSLLHVEVQPAAELDADPAAPHSLSYVTRFRPDAAPDLGIEGNATDRGSNTVPRRWVGNRRIAFDVPITPTRAGELPVTGIVHPIYCSQVNCLVDKPYNIRWTVPVIP